MKISIDWLGDHIDLSEYSDSEISDLLTFSGIEVEGIIKIPDKVVVAQISKIESHPNADKLLVCQVDDGQKELRQIVCGANNFSEGDKVPLALPGAIIKDFEIKEAKLRGVESKGMLCSQSELGGQDSEGLWILPKESKIGLNLNEFFPSVFDLEITPNRPDCLSHIGVARELSAICSKKLKQRDNNSADELSLVDTTDEAIKIQDTNLCPLYTLRKITNVKVSPSPYWLQAKLEAIGLRSINNVVDVTNYVMMELGQPLHAFDSDKVDGEIIVRNANSKESFQALDGKSYELSPDDLIISDSKTPLALAGIMGGENSGVTDETQNILIESAFFDPSVIRKSSRRLALSSDSSYRFERGVDQNQAIKASELAVKLITDLTGGTSDNQVLISGKVDVKNRTIPMHLEQCKKILGLDIEDQKLIEILTELNISPSKEECGIIHFSIPSYRGDLTRPEDLYEEVARIIGIDKIPSLRRGWFSQPSQADKLYDFTNKTSDKLSSIGFYETRTLKLISQTQINDSLGDISENPIALKNPLSDDLTHLRPSLIPSLLTVAERNIHQGADQLRLYELGTVFLNKENRERQHIGLLISGPEKTSWSNKNPSTVDFFTLSGLIERLIERKISFLNSEFKSNNSISEWDIKLDNIFIGKAAQISPARARKMDAKHPIYVAELDMAIIMKSCSLPKSFTELPKFPSIRRDISMELPLEISNDDIIKVLNDIESEILEHYEIFDYYFDETGEKLNSDKKSLSYSLTYRNKDRTLKSKEVDNEHQKVLNELKSKLDVNFR